VGRHSIEFALILALLDELLLNDAGFVVGTLTVLLLAVLLDLGLESLDCGRVQPLVEAELPLDDADLRVHALLLVGRREERVESDAHPTVHHIRDDLL